MTTTFRQALGYIRPADYRTPSPPPYSPLSPFYPPDTSRNSETVAPIDHELMRSTESSQSVKKRRAKGYGSSKSKKPVKKATKGLGKRGCGEWKKSVVANNKTITEMMKARKMVEEGNEGNEKSGKRKRLELEEVGLDLMVPRTPQKRRMIGVKVDSGIGASPVRAADDEDQVNQMLDRSASTVGVVSGKTSSKDRDGRKDCAGDFCDCTGVWSQEDVSEEIRHRPLEVCCRPLTLSQAGETKWIDVLVGAEEREYRLPAEPLMEYCEWFSVELEKLRNSTTCGGSISDSATALAKTSVPVLRLTDVDPDLFEVIIHGILFSPRFRLRRRYYSKRSVSELDGIESSETIKKETEWPLEDLFAAYYTADRLDCVMMRDAIMDQIIREHRSYVKCTKKTCQLGGHCFNPNFCQDPERLRPVFEFFEKTSQDRVGGAYFEDFCLQYRIELLNMHDRGLPESWTSRYFWLAFLKTMADAAGDVKVFDVSLHSLGNGPEDFCAYHEHRRYGFDGDECPTLISHREEQQIAVQAAVQPILSITRYLQDESKEVIKSSRKGKMDGRELRAVKLNLQDLLESSELIVEVAKEIGRRIEGGRSTAKGACRIIPMERVKLEAESESLSRDPGNSSSMSINYMDPTFTVPQAARLTEMVWTDLCSAFVCR